MAGSSVAGPLADFPTLCDQAFGEFLRSYGFRPAEREIDRRHARRVYADNARYIEVAANLDGDGFEAEHGFAFGDNAEHDGLGIHFLERNGEFARLGISDEVTDQGIHLLGGLQDAAAHVAVLRAKEWIRQQIPEIPALQQYLDNWGDWIPWP
jgi:beta-phosphoglucomutase-like phosphatase (HAD superfamily)